MKLKLSDWSSVAEITSGIAVVVSLVFLIVGIRDNTEVTRVAVYGDLIESLNQVDLVSVEDPELSRIMAAFYQMNTKDLADSDLARISAPVRVLFRTYERAYYSRQFGIIGDAEWERFGRALCFFAERAQSADISPTQGPLLTAEFSNYIAATCIATDE